YNLNAGFVPMRKPGKLPAHTVEQSYELEYGEDSLEMHSDGIAPGERVLIVDDLIAIGGTAAAAAQLVEGVGGEVVGLGFVVELGFLGGREKLKGHSVESLIKY
ncbi:MAG: adenine phosphoribosyltransferase, partial [Thermoanaerobaculia bacterium]